LERRHKLEELVKPSPLIGDGFLLTPSDEKIGLLEKKGRLMIRKTLLELLEISASQHSHLCPRQVIGVRMGMYASDLLRIDLPQRKKRLLVIVESDGCFADGVSASTGATIGHRTLRVEDYGKIAAVFADTETGKTIRIAPVLDVRDRAYEYAPVGESRRYFAQLHGYQAMPYSELFFIEDVTLETPLDEIISRPRVRVNCRTCGEEIINEREVVYQDHVQCRPCSRGAYYRPAIKVVQMQVVEV
jgi:formylmethanofuran dehydrogenase subunit E